MRVPACVKQDGKRCRRLLQSRSSGMPFPSSNRLIDSSFSLEGFEGHRRKGKSNTATRAREKAPLKKATTAVESVFATSNLIKGRDLNRSRVVSCNLSSFSVSRNSGSSSTRLFDDPRPSFILFESASACEHACHMRVEPSVLFPTLAHTLSLSHSHP